MEHGSPSGPYPGIDRQLYRQAVSRGIEHASPYSGVERVSRPVEVLATAIELTPTLSLLAPATLHDHRVDDDDHREALRLTRAISAALVRVAHCAREVHARDVGYETDAWIEQAIALSEHLVHEQQNDDARFLEQLEEATAHLADAVVALQSDRFAFPDAVTQAQGAWLAGYARSQHTLAP